MPMIDNNNNSYTFDISLTNDCNFQCVYCIERRYFKPEYLSDNLKRKLNELTFLFIKMRLFVIYRLIKITLMLWQAINPSMPII